MKMTILGAQRKAGTYDIDGKQGDYDNIMLYCSFSDKKVEGLNVCTVKLKTVDYGAAVVQAAHASLDNVGHALKPLIGRVVDVDRDEKGHIVGAELVPAKG